MRSHSCTVQTVENAFEVAALFCDRAAVGLLGLSAWPVGLVCSSAWRVCLLSLSVCLVRQLGLVRPSGHLTLVCRLGVESRNGLHDI